MNIVCQNSIRQVIFNIFFIKNGYMGVPVVAQWLMNTTRNHEVAGSIPGLAQWVSRLVATAWIRPLAWEPPYAARAALEKAKKKTKKKCYMYLHS